MIVTLCGSARFESAFHFWNQKLTFAGHAVLELAVYPSYAGTREWYIVEQKTTLDAVHLRKVELADAVLIVTDGTGYVGESTRREIAHALRVGRAIVRDDRFPDWQSSLDQHRHRTVYEVLADLDAIECRPTRSVPPVEPEFTAVDGTVRKVHYGAGKQPWDYLVEAGWGPEFAAGNALKYVRRHGKKYGSDDLAKARWYYRELLKLAVKPNDRALTVARQLSKLLTVDELYLLVPVEDE